MTKPDVVWTDPAFALVARLLSARTGLFFRPHFRHTVENGIRSAMQRSGTENVADYYQRLQNEADILDDLIVELTVNETYFFREPVQVDFIRNTILPEVMARRGPLHTFRAWSAGCASGEEPYTLAMLIDQEGFTTCSHILATDVSSEALAKAREGVYGEWSLRDQGRDRTKGYLQKCGDLYELDERIRRQVDFEFLNLALDRYPSIVTGTKDIDLILCRNVLIYFDRETIESIAAKLFACLAKGGWLVTAASDPPLDEYAPFKIVATEAGIVYRRAPHLSNVSGEQYPGCSGLESTQTGEGWNEQSVLNSETVATKPQEPINLNTFIEAPPDPVLQAKQALREGDYQHAVSLTRQKTSSPEACEIHVQALANLDVCRAELACANATLRHPTSASLHYLHAVLLIENSRDEEAAEAVRRAIFLERELVMAHLLLGSILRRSGELKEAHKAFRNAWRLCEAQPPNQPLPMSDGETSEQLANAAKFQMQSIESILEPT